MVESKVEVLLKVSEVNLARAEKRFEAGEYDSAVFHASMAVESAANAMILKLGGDEAKDHRGNKWFSRGFKESEARIVEGRRVCAVDCQRKRHPARGSLHALSFEGRW